MPQGKGSAGRVLEHLVAKTAHQGCRDHAATVTEHASLPGATRVGRCLPRSATSSPTSSPTRRSPGTSSPSSPTRAGSPRSSSSRSRARSTSRETVFVYPAEGEAHARMRIFTPALEVPFAGHPTLGTAFVLGAPLQLEAIWLETGRGVVPVRLEREGARIVFGRMEQPIPTVEPFATQATLLAALGVERSELPVEVYDNGLHHVYVTLGSEDEVAALRPDFSRFSDPSGLLGVNTIAGSGSRWKTRMFVPHGSAARGSRDRLCGRAARAAPRPPRPDCLRRRDRDHSGRRDRPSRRRSTPASTAAPRTWSGSKSAARRSSSRAASSGCSPLYRDAQRDLLAARNEHGARHDGAAARPE